MKHLFILINSPYLKLFFASLIFLLLIYSFIRFKIKGKKNFLFLGSRFYFFIITSLTASLTLIFNGNLIINVLFAIICIKISFKDMLFLSFDFNNKYIIDMFSQYSFDDIDTILIKNYPDYTNNMIILIYLKNKQEKSLKLRYNSNIISILENAQLPLNNNYKKTNIL